MPRPEDLRSAAGDCDMAARACDAEDSQVRGTINSLRDAVDGLLDPWYGQARNDFFQLWDETVALADSYAGAARDTALGLEAHARALRNLAASIEEQERENS